VALSNPRFCYIGTTLADFNATFLWRHHEATLDLRVAAVNSTKST